MGDWEGEEEKMEAKEEEPEEGVGLLASSVANQLHGYRNRLDNGRASNYDISRWASLRSDSARNGR